METLIKALPDIIAKILFYPNVSILDKILIFFMGIILLPYLAIVLTKILNFLKKIQNFPSYHDQKKAALKSNFPTNILRNKYIQSALEKMVYESGGDRAYVIQFHNGGENIKGIPFIKFSITNEWCPINVPKESQNYKDVPLGIFSNLCYLAMRNKKMYFSDIEDLRTLDSGSYAIFKSKKIESVYVSGIFDLQDALIGLVILEHFEKTNLDSDELFVFEKTVGIISGLVLCKDGEDPTTCCLGGTCE
jgi:hypothetical protein